MSITIVGYRNCYKADVIMCLKRNFSWMKSRTDEDIEQWMEPLWNYHWLEDLQCDYPYKNGCVILNELGRVVGYFGVVCSQRYDDNGRSYFYISPSYWALDKAYRIYLFTILKKVFDGADVIGDFSAIEHVEKILVNLYKFKYIDKRAMQFIPLPLLKKTRLHFSLPSKNSLDEIQWREYEDNKQYGVKCIVCSYLNEKSFIYYKVVRIHFKHIIPLKVVHLLKVTNPSFVNQFAHEIIWKLGKAERGIVQADFRFFNGSIPEYPLIRLRSKVRLVSIKEGISLEEVDFLYSELSMLNDRQNKAWLL